MIRAPAVKAGDPGSCPGPGIRLFQFQIKISRRIFGFYDALNISGH